MFPKDLSECIWVPALEQLSLLLEYEVIKIRVCGHYNWSSNQVGLEDWSIPEKRNKKKRTILIIYLLPSNEKPKLALEAEV